MIRDFRALVFALASTCFLQLVRAQAIPAFSGADGAGATATGGRGGIVYHVTRLDGEVNSPDRSVLGTLAYGLNDANFPKDAAGNAQPRTIVFDVGGTIFLGRVGESTGWDSQDPISAGTQSSKTSNITIAGQTAPGGIRILGGGLKVNGNNTIVRNLTIAPGYGARSIGADGMPDSYVFDAMNIHADRVMVDHVSAIFATDETISLDEFANHVTVQYSNISQGQNYPQLDAEGGGYTGHALGSLIQPGTDAQISIHHNLYAHQKGRLPRVGSEVGTGAYNDFRNNVFYNWLSTAGTGAGGQPSFNNFVSNYWRAGPGGDNPTTARVPTIGTTAGGTTIFNGQSSVATRIYHTGNVKDVNKNSVAEFDAPLTNADFGLSTFAAAPYIPDSYVGVTDSPANAYERVLDYMGAFWWTRDGLADSIDERIIQEVRTGTGKIIAWADDPNNPNDGQEWQAMLALRQSGGVAPFQRPAGWDNDGDGMPADWEVAHGLDPVVADNNGDFDADGYTNLEEYLNELAEWPAPGPIAYRGGASGRYAEIGNWDVNPDPNFVGPWQPSKYDVAQIRGGRAIVDAVGQHARVLEVAPQTGDDAAIEVTNGWIVIEQQLTVGAGGSGMVNHNGGLVIAEQVILGGSDDAAGVYNLSATGHLRVGALAKGASGGEFNFTGGTLSAGEVMFGLVNNGGVIAPGRSPGLMHVVGDLKLNSGELEIELAGSADGQFDKLVIDGELAAGGVLRISLLDGYLPSVGDSFDLLDFRGAIGSFAFDLPELGPRMKWESNQLLITGVIAVVAVPETGGVGLAAIAAILSTTISRINRRQCRGA